MIIPLIAHLQAFGEAGYMAWIDNSRGKGMVVQAATAEQAAKELLISLKVKLSYDLGIDINDIEERQFESEEAFKHDLLKEGIKELKLQVA